MIRKVLTFEVKEVRDRVLEFVGSTEDSDRVGDIIMAQGWQLKNYKKNPVFLWAHQYDGPPVGKAVKVWIDENRLKFHVEFADKETYEFADTVYKLYKGGFLRATSVGFMPIESEPIEVKDDDEHAFFDHVPTRYLKQDLLELSGCPVPANPFALAEAKAMGLINEHIELKLEAQSVLAQIEGISEKPYPNEHACRLRNPDDFQEGTFKRTQREHEGKQYSIIMGRLKGEDTMTEQAYRYDKEVWTASEAKVHCKDHEGTFEPASEAQAEEVRSAISYQSAHPDGTPKAPEDEAWDAGKEVAEAEVDDLKIMCSIVQGDAEQKTSYKLPHHTAKGHKVVWKGVAAAGAVLMGSRGGIDATEAEKTGAKAHLAKHYEEFDKTPPWEEKSISQEAIADEIDYLAKAIEAEGLNEENKLAAWELVRWIMRIPGSDIPVDISERFIIKKPEYTEDDVRAIAEAAAEAVVNQAKGKLRR